MKQIIASVFFDILYYTIGNIIFCIFKFTTTRIYKLRLAKVIFPSCLYRFIGSFSWVNVIGLTFYITECTDSGIHSNVNIQGRT